MSKTIDRPVNRREDLREEYYHQRARAFGENFPEFDWPSVQLIYDLAYTYDTVNSHFARETATKGLSPTSFNLLMILRRSDKHRLPLHELSSLLLVSRANITGLVDCLEKRGLVERLPEASDRRVKLARLTDEGVRLLDGMLPAHYSGIREMLSGLSSDDKLQLGKLLGAMRQSVSKLAVE